MWAINKILLVANACASLVMLYVGEYGFAGLHSTVVALMLAVHFAAEAHKAREEKDQ